MARRKRRGTRWMRRRLLRALSHRRSPTRGSKPRLDVYQLHNRLNIQENLVAHIDNEEVRRIYENPDGIDISYTTMGRRNLFKDRDDVRILILHGVPTRKEQWYPVQELLALFAYTVSFDMLGMGNSTKRVLRDYTDAYLWKNDLSYVRDLAIQVFGWNETNTGPKSFIFLSDDWGSGIHAHYAAKFSQDLEGNVMLDPIAFDGYPVKEIEAVGRTAPLPEGEFRRAMGGFDQTLVQILKTMVYDPNKWNQRSQEEILSTYSNVNYLKSPSEEMEVVVEYDENMKPIRTATVRGFSPLDPEAINFHNLRVLAQRASVLSPAQTLPYEQDQSPGGVAYDEWLADTLILWGEYDNMMPNEQQARFRGVLVNAACHTQKIPRAGHFAGVDQPELVAEAIMAWISAKPEMRARLNDVYIGFTGIWKGDEDKMIADLRNVYGLQLDRYVVHEVDIAEPVSDEEEEVGTLDVAWLNPDHFEPNKVEGF